MDELDLLEEQGRQEKEAKKQEKKTPEAKAKRNRGRAQRNRGLRVEREMAKRLARFGFSRVPLSGAVGGSWRGDLRRPTIDKAITVIEVKRREKGFTTLQNWLAQGGGVDALIIDPGGRSKPMAVMYLDKLEELFEEAGYSASGDQS